MEESRRVFVLVQVRLSTALVDVPVLILQLLLESLAPLQVLRQLDQGLLDQMRLSLQKQTSVLLRSNFQLSRCTVQENSIYGTLSHLSRLLCVATILSIAKKAHLP